jgi:hypothetical protein
MSCLEATFTLTPRSPSYSDASLNNIAYLYCWGPYFGTTDPTDLSSLYLSNRFFFARGLAGDPNLDYTQWPNRKIAPILACYINLAGYAGPGQKQLALIFGFDLWSPMPAFQGRVLVYSDAGLLRDQTLVYPDNQFLLEIESVDLPLNLYFVHAGGHWFFRGLSGYVV